MDDNPSDFEVVTWAVDNGWERRTFDSDGMVEWHFGTARFSLNGALREMREQYAEEHKPRLAERCCRVFYRAWNAPGYPHIDWRSDVAQNAIAAVQRVLDEEPR